MNCALADCDTERVAMRSGGSQKPIEAITFDVGGTLIEPWPSVGHVYATVAGEHGIEGLSPDQLNDRFVTVWKALGCRAESRTDWAAIVEATFQGVATITDLRSLFESLYTRFMEPAVWHVFEDVRPTLMALQSRGLRLAILSNWDERLRPLLTRLELLEFFEFAMVSSEVGSRKPEPEIFHQTVAAFGLHSGQVLHVGDSFKHDVEGARAVGMQAVGIHRQGKGDDPFWIESLDGLLECL